MLYNNKKCLEFYPQDIFYFYIVFTLPRLVQWGI